MKRAQKRVLGTFMKANIARLTKNMTKAERMLLLELQKRGLTPLVQYGIYSKQSFYILDFYFPLQGVAIELDGWSHDDRVTQDIERDTYLWGEKGIMTVRIPNEFVYQNAPDVAQAISYFLTNLPTKLSLKEQAWEIFRTHTRNIHTQSRGERH